MKINEFVNSKQNDDCLPGQIETPIDRFRIRLGAVSLAISGILFVLYPAIRPFSDESSLQGARAFASFSWILAHSLAMLAFILLTLGFFGLYLFLRKTTVEHRAFQALILNWIGVGLTLPYYGAETFGLHAISQEAISQNNPALLSMVNSVRWEQGIVFILIGLIFIAVSTIMFASAVWASGTMPGWSGIPLAIGFALYIPQYVAPKEIRVAHRLLIMDGCILLGWNMSKHRNVS